MGGDNPNPSATPKLRHQFLSEGESLLREGSRLTTRRRPPLVVRC